MEKYRHYKMAYESLHGGDRDMLIIYSVVGILFVIVLGFIAHFLFEATNRNPVVAAFTPVNESVWEHIKLLVFPYLLFVFLMWLVFGGCIDNFIPGIILGVIVGSIFMVFAFYTYIGALTREHDLSIDIMIFILAIILTFIVAYCVFVSPTLSHNAHLVSAISLAFYVLLLILFTYYPIEIPLLQDPITNGYGIVGEA